MLEMIFILHTWNIETSTFRTGKLSYCTTLSGFICKQEPVRFISNIDLSKTSSVQREVLVVDQVHLSFLDTYFTLSSEQQKPSFRLTNYFFCA